MNRKHLFPRRITLAAASLLAALHAAPALADDGERIEGTWINEVKIVVCAAPHTVLASFTSMTTYFRGGVLIEGGGPPAPPPAVSRSAGQGVWKRTGSQQIQALLRSHSFDSLGRLVRITEVSSVPALELGDNPATPDVIEPYYLSGWGTNRITNIDPATGAVTSVLQGCNYAASRPMLID